MCGLHQTGWAGRAFAVLWLLKLCGMFKARRDRLQAWRSVEVDTGGSSSCWRFGLPLEVATQLSLGFMAVVQTALLCMLMVFPGGYVMLPLCLGCLCVMKASCILQITAEKLLLKCSLLVVLVGGFCQVVLLLHTPCYCLLEHFLHAPGLERLEQLQPQNSFCYNHEWSLCIHALSFLVVWSCYCQ